MPLRLDVQRILCGRSERVKSVDIHPKEPWIVSGLYSGNVFIWNYETEVIVRTFEVSEVPIRAVKFIVRKNWIVTGSDDMYIRLYNYNTCEKVREFEAHTDYIRSIAVHPSLPFILSGSDDMSIKLWDWDRNFQESPAFEGHTHYVMQVVINPKDTNSFASASLDRSIKVWGLNSSVPHFQLEGHDRGVNCVAYYSGGEKPFLISGADDNLCKVWDFQTKTCVATLEGHTANISAVMFHPTLPIIITGSEDGSIKIWHSNTYRLETTLHYGMERVWSLCCLVGSNKVGIGFDEGTIMISLGQEEPVVSMDNNGKVIWSKNHEIQLTNVLRIDKKSIVDGEELALVADDLGSVEFYPNIVRHNKNGQLVAVCGDGEYTIYTALRLKNKTFGQALDFVWCSNKANVYATRETTQKIKIFSKFKESNVIRTSYQVDQIFGGHLLALCSSEFIDFYDWDNAKIIRRIEVSPTQVHWSDNGSLVSIVCSENYYVLRYNEEVVDKYLSQNIETDEQGIEPAFDLENDINDTVTSASFSGEIFIYTNKNCRLNYYVGGQCITLTHLDNEYYILGYLLKENRIYLIDKRYNIISYELLRYVLAYQAAIVRGDLDKAQQLLKRNKIPKDYFNKLGHFLENQGHIELALEVSNDIEHKFELCLQLKKLKLAKDILLKSPTLQKWKQLGDLALVECDFKTFEECCTNSGDLSSLFLFYTSTNNNKKLENLSKLCIEKRRYDIAFNCLFILNKINDIIDLLIKCNRIPEAAFISRSYKPSRINNIQKIWKNELNKISPTAAKSLGDIHSHPQHFVLQEQINNDNSNSNNINDTINSNSDEQKIEQKEQLKEDTYKEKQMEQNNENEIDNNNNNINSIKDEISPSKSKSKSKSSDFDVEEDTQNNIIVGSEEENNNIGDDLSSLDDNEEMNVDISDIIFD